MTTTERRTRPLPPSRLIYAEAMKNYTIRLTPTQWATFQARGGVTELRQFLDMPLAETTEQEEKQ